MSIPALMPVYPRCDVRPVKGEHCHLIDEDGTRYLDFASGIAVNLLGHSHEGLIGAIQRQAETLMHVSNLYGSPHQEKLAQMLVDASFADTVFFTNSGAEAVECAIKTARAFHQHEDGDPARTELITFTSAFHGRTMATISASNQAKMHHGFLPLLQGFKYCEFDDLAAAKAAIGPQTAGFLVEPIQGEGGIRPASQEFMQGLRDLADEHGLMLVLDEVQCGVARTGKFYAHELYGVKPDIVASAKGIGGGFPLGACLATEHAARGMTFGTHGSTYGGNPLAMAAGVAVMEAVANDEFLQGVREKGARLKARLEQFIGNYPDLFELVRGEGLMLGIKMKVESRPFFQHLRDKHQLLTVAAGDNTLRVLPPLVVGDAEIDEFFDKLSAGAADYEVPDAELMGTRHFLDLSDAGGDALAAMLNDAIDRKGARKSWPKGKADADAPLAGHVLAMIFEKSSTRTRVSFDIAMRQLGGSAIVMESGSMQLGRGESIADTARVLSRMVDAIMIRTDDHAKVEEMARHASVPVINGLTDASHPCQIVADLLTIIEHGKALPGLELAWLGDGNNVLHSILEAAGIFKFNVRVATPAGFEPEATFVEAARAGGATITLTQDAQAAARDADVIVTDTWVSMGQENAASKIAAMQPFQVNDALMALAKPEADFLHCLPAHVGDEVTQSVIEGPQSRVFDEAENRIHAQKSVLLWAFDKL